MSINHPLHSLSIDRCTISQRDTGCNPSGHEALSFLFPLAQMIAVTLQWTFSWPVSLRPKLNVSTAAIRTLASYLGRQDNEYVYM